MRTIANIALALVVLATVSVAAPADAQTDTARIVSTSGIPHHDVGNYTKSPHWQPGRDRGIPDHPTWRDSIDTVLGRLASEQGDAYLHTGDMVSGKWGLDKDRPKNGTFGPTDTLAQKEAQVLRAGDLYYRQNLSWWERNGIPRERVHFAMGDHEYGNIDGGNVIRPNQLEFVDEHRAVWSKHFVAGRGYRRLTDGQQRHAAYATMLPGRVGLVTLDPVIKQNGGMRPRIGGPQERWLRDTLRRLRLDGARWLIVQTETPMVGPNRKQHSSGLLLENGDAMWRMMREEGVDLVLAAEFHDVTARTTGGATPMQVVHGGQLYQANANYLVMDVSATRLELTHRSMSGTRAEPASFWAPHEHRAPGVLRMGSAAPVTGRATVHLDGAVSGRSGTLTEGP